MLAGVLQENITNMKENITSLKGQLEAARAAGDVGLFETIANQIVELQVSIAEATAQAFQDSIDAVEKAAGRREAGLALRGRLADLQERGGDRLGAVQARQGVSADRVGSLRTQRTELQGLLNEAISSGNLDKMQELGDKIADLDVTIQEEIQTQEDLIYTYRAVATEILTGRTDRTTGIIATASGIIRKAGELIGNVNFPKLIELLQKTGDTLRTTATEIATNIRDSIANSEFGAEGGGILAQLVAAFQQGPEQFGSVLAQLGPAIAALEAGMSPEQKAAFQALIASMVDNTTAVLDNSDQLNQLTSRNNAQGFASSLWSQFRVAVFTGSGRILPQFQFPQMQSGGYIHSTGLYNLHAGEVVVPASQVNAGAGAGGSLQQNLYITNPTEVADPDYIFAVAEFNRSNRRAT